MLRDERQIQSDENRLKVFLNSKFFSITRLIAKRIYKLNCILFYSLLFSDSFLLYNKDEKINYIFRYININSY